VSTSSDDIFFVSTLVPPFQLRAPSIVGALLRPKPRGLFFSFHFLNDSLLSWNSTMHDQVQF